MCQPEINLFQKNFKEYVKNNYDELKSIVKETPNGHAFRISEKLTFDVDEKKEKKNTKNIGKKVGFNLEVFLKI